MEISKYLPTIALLLTFVPGGLAQVDVTALTCNDDKTIDLTVANADGSYVSIVGCSEEQTISAGTATLSTCSLSWDTTYVVRIYQNQGVFLTTDFSTSFACTRRVYTFTAVFTDRSFRPTMGMQATDGTVTDLVEPTVTMSITTDSAGTTAATTVAVGTTLYLNIDLGSDFIVSDGFDIRAKTITVSSAGTTVTLTGDAADGDGCQSQTYWGSTTDLGQGALQIQFNAFMIVTGTSVLDTQVFRATVEVCTGTTCAAYTCGSERKKRSVTDEKSEFVEAQSEVVVVGVAIQPDNGDNGTNNSDVNSQTGNDVCVTKTSFYGISIFILVALALSVTAACFMFFRSRRAGARKNEPEYRG